MGTLCPRYPDRSPINEDFPLSSVSGQIDKKRSLLTGLPVNRTEQSLVRITGNIFCPDNKRLSG